MKIERVDIKKKYDKEGRPIKEKVKNLDYLLYLSIAGLIIPFGIILGIYVLFKIGDKKVKGSANIAKILAWINIFLSILGILTIIFIKDYFNYFVGM